MLKQSIEKLMRRENLDTETCFQALQEITAVDANPLQTAAFLVLLRAKPETASELAAFAVALKEKMRVVPMKHKVLDIVGTGGDGANTINISTGSAILAASCGVKIAKHGNRAVSSLAGSADVLEALGITIDLSPEKISACIDTIGIGFCFAPNFHPMLRALSTLRKQLNIATTFNILAPLLNPAQPGHFIIGIFDERLMLLMAEALMQLNIQHSMIVHGSTLDEISCVGPTKVIEVSPKGLTQSVIEPEQFGLRRCKIVDLRGGNAHQNAKLLHDTFAGMNTPRHNAIADTLILNAAVAQYLYGVTPSINDGVKSAREKLQNGTALQLLKNWIAYE